MEMARPPAFYPGSLYNGIRLAFGTTDSIGDGSQLVTPGRDKETVTANDVKAMVLNAFRQMQGDMDEMRAGWSSAREELVKMSNSVDELKRELVKQAFHMNMLENRMAQLKKTGGRPETANGEKPEYASVQKQESGTVPKPETQTVERPETAAASSLEPDRLKEWQEWQEPEEWRESSK